MDDIREIKTDVIMRLVSFGYTVTDEDLMVIPLLIDKVSTHIKNLCNVQEVPDGLRYNAVDMVCGELLYIVRQRGGLDEIFNVDNAVKAVQEGDTTVTFQDGGDTLGNFITSLMRSGEGDFACYRKLRW